MLEEAIRLARINPILGLPKMAAVICKRHQLIGWGWNSYKTDPLMQRFSDHDLKNCLHAELAAIKNALRSVDVDYLPQCSIHIARVLKNGSVALAAPCGICREALSAFGIVKVEYTKNLESNDNRDYPCLGRHHISNRFKSNYGNTASRR